MYTWRPKREGGTATYTRQYSKLKLKEEKPGVPESPKRQALAYVGVMFCPGGRVLVVAAGDAECVNSLLFFAEKRWS